MFLKLQKIQFKKKRHYPNSWKSEHCWPAIWSTVGKKNWHSADFQTLTTLVNKTIGSFLPLITFPTKVDKNIGNFGQYSNYTYCFYTSGQKKWQFLSVHIFFIFIYSYCSSGQKNQQFLLVLILSTYCFYSSGQKNWQFLLVFILFTYSYYNSGQKNWQLFISGQTNWQLFISGQ